MRSMLILVLAAGLALFPYGAAVEAQNASSGRPPIEQPLVSEGQFAVELANALGLTSSQSEAAAEDALTRVNIAPRNGWISDYPMTPDIIEEVRQSAAGSASAGALKMSEADAARTVVDVSTAMNLPVREGGKYSQPGNEYAAAPGAPASEPGAYGAPGEYVEPSAIASYYSDYGPPLVSYYAPPWEYAYLYNWVPYPFWWSGFYFGGYYILGDFDRGGGHYHHYYHGGHGNRWAGHRITNHVSGANGAVTRINPVTRATGGTRSATFSGRGRSLNMQRFNSPGARAGERAILDRSSIRNPVGATRNPGGFGGTGRAYHGGTHSGAHGFSGTQSRSAYSGGHNFGGPSASHSFSRGAFRGGMGGGFRSRGFGGGGFGGHGGGGHR